MTVENFDLSIIDEPQKENFFALLLECTDDEIMVSDLANHNREKMEQRWETALNLIPGLKEVAIEFKDKLLLGIKTFKAYDSLMQYDIQHHFEQLDDSLVSDIVVYWSSAKAQKAGKTEVTHDIYESMTNNLNSINKDWSQITPSDVIKAAILGQL